MGKYLLGLDNGNTVSKVAIFDLQGNEQVVTSCKVKTEYPHPGWIERSMEGLWQGVVGAIQQALAQSAIDPKDIVGIGCSGHGNGMYLLDKAGQPLRNGIQSLDTRASAVVDVWLEQGMAEKVFPYTLQAVWAAQPPSLLAWLKQHYPDEYAQIGAVLMCKDYVNYRLTGEIVTDYSDVSATGLLEVPHKRYNTDLLDLLGIPEMQDALPRLAHSHEIAGHITLEAAEATGLAVGTPVVVGLMDIDSSAIGAGVNQVGQACIIAGTWSINEVVTATPLADPNVFITCIYAVPDTWLALEASATSATNLEWFVTQFCAEERLEAERRGISIYEVCNEALANIPIDSSNIIFHPFLYGSNVQANARSGFYGMAGWHTRHHLLRALYEGVVFSHLNHIEKLRQAGGIFDRARLTGGGSRSQIWSQMFADILETPIEIPDGRETGALGAALTAGVGTGLYADYAEAVEQAVSVVRTHDPNPQHAPIYQARYQEYKRLLEAMQTPWDHLAQLESRME
jgi:L-xylulokinase